MVVFLLNSCFFHSRQHTTKYSK